jgi:hypothetical protein
MAQSQPLQPSASVPECFTCCLTRQIMVWPVVDRQGNSFERDAITAWLAKQSSSPLTRVPMSTKDLAPNRALSDAIHGFLLEMTAADVSHPVLLEFFEGLRSSDASWSSNHVQLARAVCGDVDGSGRGTRLPPPPPALVSLLLEQRADVASPRTLVRMLKAHTGSPQLERSVVLALAAHARSSLQAEGLGEGAHQAGVVPAAPRATLRMMTLLEAFRDDVVARDACVAVMAATHMFAAHAVRAVCDAFTCHTIAVEGCMYLRAAFAAGGFDDGIMRAAVPLACAAFVRGSNMTAVAGGVTIETAAASLLVDIAASGVAPRRLLMPLIAPVTVPELWGLVGSKVRAPLSPAAATHGVLHVMAFHATSVSVQRSGLRMLLEAPAGAGLQPAAIGVCASRFPGVLEIGKLALQVLVVADADADAGERRQACCVAADILDCCGDDVALAHCYLQGGFARGAGCVQGGHLAVLFRLARRYSGFVSVCTAALAAARAFADVLTAVELKELYGPWFITSTAFHEAGLGLLAAVADAHNGAACAFAAAVAIARVNGSGAITLRALEFLCALARTWPAVVVPRLDDCLRWTHGGFTERRAVLNLLLLVDVRDVDTHRARAAVVDDCWQHVELHVSAVRWVARAGGVVESRAAAMAILNVLREHMSGTNVDAELRRAVLCVPQHVAAASTSASVWLAHRMLASACAAPNMDADVAVWACGVLHAVIAADDDDGVTAAVGALAEVCASVAALPAASLPAPVVAAMLHALLATNPEDGRDHLGTSVSCIAQLSPALGIRVLAHFRLPIAHHSWACAAIPGMLEAVAGDDDNDDDGDDDGDDDDSLSAVLELAWNDDNHIALLPHVPRLLAVMRARLCAAAIQRQALCIIRHLEVALESEADVEHVLLAMAVHASDEDVQHAGLTVLRRACAHGTPPTLAHSIVFCALRVFAREWYGCRQVCADTMEILTAAAQHTQTRVVVVAVAEETVRQLADTFWGMSAGVRPAMLAVVTPALRLLDAVVDAPRMSAHKARFDALRLAVAARIPDWEALARSNVPLDDLDFAQRADRGAA